MGIADGRVALVTGAGRGIGRAIALGLAREGASVALVARTRVEIEEVAREIAALGGRALSCVADVAAEGEVAASVSEIVRELGPVDILINNAGHNVLGAIDEMAVDVWWRQIEVNLKGTYLYSRAVIHGMVERGWGRIVNVSSTQGKRGEKFLTAYCSAKHGVIGLTRALAMEVIDKGVTVNAICPGWVPTTLTKLTMAMRAELHFGIKDQAGVERMSEATRELLPQKKTISPEEVVPAVLFLVSEGSSRITGEAMNVSGGSVMY